MNLVEIVQQALQGEISPDTAKIQIRESLAHASLQERSKSSCLVRLCRSLANLGKNESIQDVSVHLRQAILMFRQKFVVKTELADSLRSVTQPIGLRISIDNEVDADMTYPHWFRHSDKLQDIYAMERSRKIPTPMGDNLLYRMTSFTHYKSPAQKNIVHASMSMQDGETLLACLPTGGGKSLVGQIPAFFETQGGTLEGLSRESVGMTIVVVPTVALAIDQCEKAQEYFTKAFEGHKPRAYMSTLSSQEKQEIFDEIGAGTLPLLFTSPEALMGGSLFDIILEVARKKSIKRLVIDEAHIVAEWGTLFRTDFQFLSVFRKKLLEASEGRLKTILLSATLAQPTVTLLKKLFAETGKYTEIRSDALRFEPMFFMDFPESEGERQQRIVEILPFLPRPVILYVNEKEQAIEWTEKIRQMGYQSVSCFTGDTSAHERKQTVQDWNNDQIDIMVATSAFGMGVDKPDIRTIIHCCMPESVNRFYQEVGRGGRDGFPSISLLSFVKTDEDIARSFISKNILTSERAVARWEGMKDTPIEQVNGDTYWLGMNRQPRNLQGSPSGKQNMDWNEATLLLLYRNQLIDLLDVKVHPDTNVRELKVKILDSDTFNDSSVLLDSLEPERQRERKALDHSFGEMKTLLAQVGKENCCISEFLIETYSYTGKTCGGCPYCHRKNDRPQVSFADTEMIHRAARQQQETQSPLRSWMAGYREVLINYELQQDQGLEVVAEVISELVFQDVKYFVLPELTQILFRSLLERVPNERNGKLSWFLSYEEFLQKKVHGVTGAVAVFYPQQSSLQNEELYSRTQKFLEDAQENIILHIAPANMMIKHKNRRIQEIVDGGLYSIDFVLKQKRDPSVVAFY